MRTGPALLRQHMAWGSCDLSHRCCGACLGVYLLPGLDKGGVPAGPALGLHKHSCKRARPAPAACERDPERSRGKPESLTLRRAPWPQVGQRTTCRAQPQRGQPQLRTRAAGCGMRSKCGPRCAWTHAAPRACRAAGGQYTHRAARARQWRRASRPTMASSTAQRALSRAVAVARNAQQRQSATGAGAPRQLR